MIPHAATNKLYLADTLPKKYATFWKHFERILKENQVEYQLLAGTNDVWARDYMPIQVVENAFIQFTYQPDYLQNKQGQKSITNTTPILRELGISALTSDIVLDGGNVVGHKRICAVTEKIFRENPRKNETQLLHELEQLLQVERIILLPEHPLDFTGHADGMLRFLNEQTVLVNDFSKEDAHFYRQFKNTLHNSGLEVVEIPYNPYQNTNDDHANGCYVNYLQLSGLVFLPQYDLPEDEKVFTLFQKLFPTEKIVPVNCNEIAKDGGVLNCIAWNVL